MAKGKVNKTVNMTVQIGSWGFDCPALENFDLKTIHGKPPTAKGTAFSGVKSINDLLNDGWSLVGIELRNPGFHPNPLKNAKKTTSKGNLEDSDKFGMWWGTFTKVYPG